LIYVALGAACADVEPSKGSVGSGTGVGFVIDKVALPEPENIEEPKDDIF
jgi:hypothetical protein